MGNLESLLDRAKRLATERHAGQIRKDGITPYITHPAAVVRTLEKAGVTDENVLAAGWLHDVVEDTPTTVDEIKNLFGDRVAEFVSLLTRDGPREEYNLSIIQEDSYGLLIKIADLEHNWTTIQELSIPSQIRKYIETRTYFLPAAKTLTVDLGCEWLYDTLAGHVETYEKRVSGD